MEEGCGVPRFPRGGGEKNGYPRCLFALASKQKGACALRRRQYDVDFKIRVAREAVETGNGTVVARRYELAPALVNRWANSYRSHGDAAFDPRKRRSRSSEDAAQRASEFEKENDRLKRLLGEKDLEIAILRDLLKKGPHH